MRNSNRCDFKAQYEVTFCERFPEPQSSVHLVQRRHAIIWMFSANHCPISNPFSLDGPCGDSIRWSVYKGLCRLWIYFVMVLWKNTL